MKKFVLLVFCQLFIIALYAQKAKSVRSEYIYNAPENITPEKARQIAIERAKIQAIADEFGTIVNQTNFTNINNNNGLSSLDFQSVGISEVNGEWIEDIEKPRCEVSFEQGMMVVKAFVYGKIRELQHNVIDCDVHLLRNGKDLKYESETFSANDQIYLAFKAPVNGFIAVYLVDEDNNAYCLLPYPQQNGVAYSIKANKSYLLFDRGSVPTSEEPYVEEYNLTTSRQLEHNVLYVLFSTNQFTKALDNQADALLPSELKEDNFQKWMAKCRRHDKDMQLTRIPITIKQI